MKKSNLKKIFGLLLATSMVFGVAGCGQETSQETPAGNSNEAGSQTAESVAAETEPAEQKDPVTLEWYYRGNGIQKDTEAVEEYVNSLLKNIEGLEHVTIHMNCFIGSDYQNQVLLAQTSGTQMDILNTVSLASWSDEIDNGTYLAIDDYLANDYSALYEELPEWLWESMQVD